MKLRLPVSLAEHEETASVNQVEGNKIHRVAILNKMGSCCWLSVCKQGV